jgi:hypothetical protein
MATTKDIKARAVTEQLIDEVGLQLVLDAIAVVCAEKGDHVTYNWQDSSLAQRWRNCSDVVATAAAGVGQPANALPR